MLEIRKVVTYVEEIRTEGGKPVDPPITMVAAMAVIKNPWAGRGFVDDLRPEINAYAPQLGEILVKKIQAIAGTAPDNVAAYGKAAVAGLDGEIEHASGVIHTLLFGNKIRDAAKGTSFLSFTNTRGGAGAPVMIPMVHKTDDSVRSHYLTLEAYIPDAPRADEIIVALGVSTRGRAHPRIGDRKLDLQELENK